MVADLADPWGLLVIFAVGSAAPAAESFPQSVHPYGHFASAFCCYAVLLTLIIYGSRQLMKKKGFSAEANMGFNILIAVIGSLVLMGGLVWTGFRIAKAPSLQGHVNAETRTSPAYPAGDTEHTYTVYHDPLPLTVEDLVGETAYTDYSCYRAVEGTPLMTAYKYRQEVPYVFDIVSEEDGPELLYEIYEVKLDCLYEPVKQSFFKDKTLQYPRQIQICGFPKLDAGGRRPLGRFGRLPVHPGGQHAHREFPALLRRPLRGDPL